MTSTANPSQTWKVDPIGKIVSRVEKLDGVLGSTLLVILTKGVWGSSGVVAAAEGV